MHLPRVPSLVFTIVDTNGEYILSSLAEEAADAAVKAKGITDAAEIKTFSGGYIASFYSTFFLWVNVIGLSILSGAHNAIVPRVLDLLREKDMTDVKVVVGGIIPDEDAAALKQQGVAAVFQPGASLEEIVKFVRAAVVVA